MPWLGVDMAFTYNINNKIDDTKSRNALLVCHSMTEIIELFITTFLVAYIYSFDTNPFAYIKNVGIYYLFKFFVQSFTTIIGSKVVDTTNRIWTYRFAIMLRAVFVVIIIFAGSSLSKILPLAGILVGIVDGCYYAAYNIIKQEMVSRKNYNRFSLLYFISVKAIGVVFPLIFGTLIDASSYSMVAILVFFIALVQIIISVFIASQKPEDSEFSIKSYNKKLVANPEVLRRIRLIYMISCVYAVSSILSVLTQVMIMLEFKTNFSMGWLTSVCAAVSIVMIFVVGKLTKPTKRSWLFIVSSIIIVASVTALAIITNQATIIIFNIAYVISGYNYRYVFDVYRNQTLKEAGLYSEIGEHQALIEFLLCMSRSIAFIILIAVSLFRIDIILKVFMVANSLFAALLLVLCMRYENKYAIVTQSSQSQEQNTLEK